MASAPAVSHTTHLSVGSQRVWVSSKASSRARAAQPDVGKQEEETAEMRDIRELLAARINALTKGTEEAAEDWRPRR